MIYHQKYKLTIRNNLPYNHSTHRGTAPQPFGRVEMFIIETSDNRFYRVFATGDADLDHVWYGFEVKNVHGRWIDKKNARKELVRKAATRVVQS